MIGIWIIMSVLLILTVTRIKIREAFVIFSFKQVQTWLLGLVVVQYNLLEYPVREFANAARNSFSFEYFIYPAICVVFNLKFPEKKGIIPKTLWFLFFPSWMTALEVLLEKHTHLIHYITWHWYWTWISLLITFYVDRSFYLWFIRKQTGGIRSAK